MEILQVQPSHVLLGMCAPGPISCLRKKEDLQKVLENSQQGPAPQDLTNQKDGAPVRMESRRGAGHTQLRAALCLLLGNPP